MIERKIGNVKVEIDVRKANEIYLEEDVANNIQEEGINGVLNAIYLSNNCNFLPLSIFIELTSKCNFNCPYCYINIPNKKVHKEIEFEDLKKTLDYFINRGLLYVVLSGGECMIHPCFKELYIYLKKSGVLVSVFTNGSLINNDILELFEKYKPFKVEVSLYGFDDETYRKSTQTFVKKNQIYNNVLRLKQKGINVVCKTLITKFTESSYNQIKSWCKDNDIEFYAGIEMLDTYSNQKTTQYSASDNAKSEFEKESKERFFSDPEMMKIGYSSIEKKKAFDCSAGKWELLINSNFEIVPSMLANTIREWRFAIENGGVEQAYELLTKKIEVEKNRALEGCRGCAHHNICQECFLTKYNYEDLRQRQNYCEQLSEYMKRK